jgi:type VI secretion system protein ImpM
VSQPALTRSMDDEPTRLPGWFGKMPSLGDFASRRLPSRFLTPWDDWLQRALASSRALLGSGWLELYLSSPIWRFLLFPGVCSHSGWAGVMMPSVDRVGRYFPLTIAAELPAFPVGLVEVANLDSWIEALETVALATLDGRYLPEQLDAALQDHLLPECRGATLAHGLGQRLLAHGALTAFPLSGQDAFAAVLGEAATAQLLEGSGAKSLWWSRGREGGQPVLACCDGLPIPEDFSFLLHCSAGGCANNNDAVTPRPSLRSN